MYVAKQMLLLSVFVFPPLQKLAQTLHVPERRPDFTTVNCCDYFYICILWHKMNTSQPN